MKKINYLVIILTIELFGCNPKIDFNNIVPNNVNEFATGFITEIHKGNIDTCLTLLIPEISNGNSRQFLTNAYNDIKGYSIDSFAIINARKTNLLGTNGYTNYSIDYEYKISGKFLYFSFGIRQQNEKLIITAFNGTIKEESLSEFYAFNLDNKGILHYLFLFFVIIIPIFILVTLFFAIRTNITKKWLWIVGILFGIIKFSINWTTGQVGFSLLSISILGAGYSRSGNIAPWILSFSLPIVAILFWFKRSQVKIEEVSQTRLDEEIKDNESQAIH